MSHFLPLKPTKVNELTVKGLTPLHLSLRTRQAGSWDVFRWLMEAEDIDVNAFDENGYTPLTLACIQSQSRVALEGHQWIRLLISHPNINANAYDSQGLTALLRCINNHIDDQVIPVRRSTPQQIDRRRDSTRAQKFLPRNK